MKVLLSIKPEFAKSIFDGSKMYEYRKKIFRKEINTVVVYASSPVQKVIGEFTIDFIDHDSLDALWGRTSEYSGISHGYFQEYFQGREKGYAIKVSDAKLYAEPMDLKATFGIVPPQSFSYIDSGSKNLTSIST
jgi:predicted transcriptional regulator